MRARFLLLASLLAVGCGRASPDAGKQPGTPAQPADNPNADVGPPLYASKADVKVPLEPFTGREPLIVPNCTVQYEERQTVSAEVDGTIELLAVRDDGIPAGDVNLVYHPRDLAGLKQVTVKGKDGRNEVIYDPAELAKLPKYRRLKEGDTVKAGQLITMLDDQLFQARKKAAIASEKAAGEVIKSASKGVELTMEKLDLTKKAEGGTSRGDILQDQITLTRFQENLAQAAQSIAKAVSELEEAQVMILKHRIYSKINGNVRAKSKHPGEFVKAGEKILEIQGTDQVRLEGFLDVQYAGLVRRGMQVTVEPAIPSAPTKTLPLHKAAVTGLAVSADPARPIVVSVSADGTGRAWDATTPNGAAVSLTHPVAVRSVACSPAGVPAVAVTGADDGKLRVFDVSKADGIPSDGKELDKAHAAAVGAIAFSPDGKFLATAAGRDVWVWDATAWKHLYSLSANEHRDAVTSLQFTPQGTLVTASRDRSLKVWKLGTEKAAVTRTIDHRTGAVDVLGVSSDGSRVVFDHDKNRLDLLCLADRQTAGTVQNVGPTATFAALAVFNRDDSLLLTAGGEGELKGGIQVWTVPPAGGRAAEAARLFTPGRVAVTAAEFSPTAQHKFLAVGTERGTVHLWTAPATRKAYTGTVEYVDASDNRQVTVRVIMDNRELGLLDRSGATVVINPGQ
ncbi:HlyD family efflux transporter periplasmic adaptor subunit [Urbifossiella limnaea]|uniref:HlyD family efflux transporter periplasmic adaptor subunit n=1 Tax=Urbifossiella limnaea TaxID=2528023 RepID=UPI00119CEA06|nr:HlyD family efflux transporter periplasmic adaptor subunit [Urbifossiella limnaea]